MKVCLAAICVLLSLSVIAQDDSAEVEVAEQSQNVLPDESTPAEGLRTYPARAIEEISVHRRKSFSRLRLEIESAEDDIISFFNELNSSDEYDINCANETSVGSHFERRDCQTGFLSDAISRNAKDYVQGLSELGSGINRESSSILLPPSHLQADLRQKSLAMEAEMLRLAQEDEELLTALQKLQSLLAAFEEKKAQRPALLRWLSR